MNSKEQEIIKNELETLEPVLRGKLEKIMAIYRADMEKMTIAQYKNLLNKAKEEAKKLTQADLDSIVLQKDGNWAVRGNSPDMLSQLVKSKNEVLNEVKERSE